MFVSATNRNHVNSLFTSLLGDCITVSISQLENVW